MKLMTDLLVVPSAKVKNEWSVMSFLPIFLHGVERENYTFYIMFFPLAFCTIMGL